MLRRLISLALLLASAPLASAPLAYSINSDGNDSTTDDSLYQIDLATGSASRIGETRPFNLQILPDIEGLAFAPDGTLYAVDDADETLLTVNLASGFASRVNDTPFNLGLPIGATYDFGLTFTCQGALMMTSDQNQTLYRVDSDTGQATVIGNMAGLGASITALAANGDFIFGLGQGANPETGNAIDPNLYRIDPDNGSATLVGPIGMGGAVAEYGDAGMAFDADGNLWAITDRSLTSQSLDALPSQVLRIDTATGAATVVSEIPADNGAVGFESLAIIAPGGCIVEPPQPPGGPIANVNAYTVPTLSPWAMLSLALMLLFSVTRWKW